MIAFCVKRGFQVNEFTQTRRGDQTTKNMEILAEASDNNISDALTHHFTREEAKKHVKHMGIEFMPTSREAVRREVCADLGETRDVIGEKATSVSLLESPPLGNDTHGGSRTKKGVGGGRQKIR